MKQNTTLMGHLGKDAEVREVNESREVCKFSLATTEHWTNKAGEKQSHTEWHDIDMFGVKGAFDNVKKYLTKGSLVEVQGVIRKRMSTNNEGQSRLFVTIVAEQRSLILLSSSASATTAATPADQSANQAPAAAQPAAQPVNQAAAAAQPAAQPAEQVIDQQAELRAEASRKAQERVREAQAAAQRAIEEAQRLAEEAAEEPMAGYIPAPGLPDDDIPF